MSRTTLSLFAAIALWPAATLAGPEMPAHVELMPGWRGEDGRQMAAFRITLEPGWHTYWRAPGEAGIPPQVNWQGSANIGAVDFHWPVPEVFDDNGMVTFGYEHELVLPFEITPLDPSQPVTVSAALALGVCRDICMPMDASVAGTLPMQGAPDRQIEFALAARPDTAEEAGVADAACEVEPIKDGLRVTARLRLPEMAAQEYAVIEPPDRAIWASEPMVHREGGVLVAMSDLVPPEAAPFDLDPGSLRLTVLGAGRAVDIEGCTGG